MCIILMMYQTSHSENISIIYVIIREHSSRTCIAKKKGYLLPIAICVYRLLTKLGAIVISKLFIA